MTNAIDTRQLERRAVAAAYEDGLTELLATAVLALLATMWIASPAFVGILAAFVVLYGWKAVERVKEWITYPRIGYHRERADEAHATARGMLLFLGAALALTFLAVAMGGDITSSTEWRRAAPLLSGLALSGGFWHLADRSRLRRHRFVAVFSVVTGVLLWWLGSGTSYEAVVWHLLGLAALLAAVGTWGLVHFVSTHPIVESDPRA